MERVPQDFTYIRWELFTLYCWDDVFEVSRCFICISLALHVFLTASLCCLLGEREEVHAAFGQPEAERCGERLHVQQTCLCHLQHGTEVWVLPPLKSVIVMAIHLFFVSGSWLCMRVLQERVQRPASDWAGMRHAGWCWQLEGFVPQSWCLPWERPGMLEYTDILMLRVIHELTLWRMSLVPKF